MKTDDGWRFETTGNSVLAIHNELGEVLSVKGDGIWLDRGGPVPLAVLRHALVLAGPPVEVTTATGVRIGTCWHAAIAAARSTETPDHCPDCDRWFTDDRAAAVATLRLASDRVTEKAARAIAQGPEARSLRAQAEALLAAVATLRLAPPVTIAQDQEAQTLRARAKALLTVVDRATPGAIAVGRVGAALRSDAPALIRDLLAAADDATAKGLAWQEHARTERAAFADVHALLLDPMTIAKGRTESLLDAARRVIKERDEAQAPRAQPPRGVRNGRLRSALETLGPRWRARGDGAEDESLNLILEELPAVLDELEGGRAALAKAEAELVRLSAPPASDSDTPQPDPEAALVDRGTAPDPFTDALERAALARSGVADKLSILRYPIAIGASGVSAQIFLRDQPESVELVAASGKLVATAPVKFTRPGVFEIAEDTLAALLAHVFAIGRKPDTQASS